MTKKSLVIKTLLGRAILPTSVKANVRIDNRLTRMTIEKKKIYCIRNEDTGRLVSNLTTRHKKYYDSIDHAQQAINNARWHDKSKLKIITFELTEVLDNA